MSDTLTPPPPPPSPQTPPSPGDETAPPAAPATPGVLRLKMIAPPVAGDVPARGWFAFGIAFYLLLSALLLGSLLVTSRQGVARGLLQMVGLGGEHWNLALFVLVVGGVALTAYAAFTVRADIATLAREEVDIEWVLKTESNGVALVFLDPAERQKRYARGEYSLPADVRVEVETLLDDRVRRVVEATQAGGATHVPVDELRGIAEKRTARLGGFARFASSLLLLLAVLGTFAGVKTALPSLIDAVAAADGGGTADGAPVSGRARDTAAGGAGSVTAASSLVAPLRAVADAFGGNALALVGAIAVGLMAQGLAAGRRNLLERLELVSAEYIYDRRRSGSADPLRVAVEALAETAGEVRDATQSLSGIEGELQGMGDVFREAFNSLNERLTDIVTQQDDLLHQRTSETLEQLGRQVVALAGAVDANTRCYTGIVDRVGERTAESREALQRMEQANLALGRALEGIAQLGDASGRASEALHQRLNGLEQGTVHLMERMESIGSGMERARPALEQVEATLRAAGDRQAAIDERAAKAWADAAEQVRKKLDTIPAGSSGGGGSGGMGGDAVGLLRRIASGVEAAQPPSPVMLATLPLLGTLGAIAIVYVLWEGVPRVLALIGLG